jgi:hypothetical protein
MPTNHMIALFMLSALALNLSPGPSILYILSRCMGQGRKAGIVSVLGLATASAIHAVAAALGLSTLFTYSPLASSAPSISSTWVSEASFRVDRSGRQRQSQQVHDSHCGWSTARGS